MEERRALEDQFVLFGAQYYRAPTPKPDQWEIDLARIREHGFNTIKVWAQWRWNNPADGVCDFSDLSRLLDLSHTNGLRVVVNDAPEATTVAVDLFDAADRPAKATDLITGEEVRAGVESGRFQVHLSLKGQGCGLYLVE